jgi:hypothetical protein
MTHIVQRTCTEVVDKKATDQLHVRSQSFSAYQHLPAYVLLGDPGVGKTTAFNQEAKQQNACYVTARDLITFGSRPEWHGKILFIDGLDEVRAGTSDARTPFDTIRSYLDKLGRPRFRLSCREADWFGATDKESLKRVSPDGEITILHLDSLTEDNIEEILNHNPKVEDTKDFMRSIEKRELSELVINPQILDMLVEAVASNQWPETRKQTFELACKTIIREHNQEYVIAHPVDENQQLQAAGFLCAVQLIAGNAGYASTRRAENDDFPYLGDVAHEDVGLLREVTRTKLFSSPTPENIAPVHRSIAEYLAANYLAECIDKDSLAVGRVIELITGEDGIVVAELRGLSAWLATLCTSQRRAIIERDPLGVVLYGDVQGFSPADKNHVLAGLKEEAARYPWFRRSNWVTSPFGALATLDMESEFLRILTDPDKSDAQQVLVDCVLDAMVHGTSYPSLDETLLRIIRDDSWWPRVRSRALTVFHTKNNSNPEKDQCLKDLLDEINNGQISDSDDTLLGYLLTQLYPRLVTAADVLNYLHIPKTKNLIGGYLTFWRTKIINLSSDADIGLIIDELFKRLETLRPTIDTHHFRSFATGMLARGLMIHGGSIDAKRLYGWLSVGLNRHGWQHQREKDNNDKIRGWLEVHGDVQKEIILFGLHGCAGKENVLHCMHNVRDHLFYASPPSNFGLWCLDQIKNETTDEVVQYLFQQAIMSLWSEKGNDGLSLELFEKIADAKPKYRTWLTEALSCSVPTADLKYEERLRIQKAQENSQKQEWLTKVYEQQGELSKGQAFPALMNDLAIAYYGRFTDSKGDTPQERLGNFLGQDEQLVRATVEGLRQTLNRDDLPELKDIFKLNVQGRTYLLSRPYLAGLEEVTKDDPEQVRNLTVDQIRKAIAFYLVDITSEDPEWYKYLLASRPELVSEVMTEYVSAALNRKKQHISGVYDLYHNDLYSAVAKSATLAMLKSFPARSTNQQLSFLNDLLKAALRYTDRQAFLQLIDKKLGFASMNVAQRVYWATAGLIAAPEKYERVFLDAIDKRESRVQHLASFLGDQDSQKSLLNGLPVPVLGMLIRLIGEFFAPYELDQSGWVSPGMSASDFVRSLINRLGLYPEKEASAMISELCSDALLERWLSKLQQTKFEQEAILREASFRHRDIDKVVQTLSNLSPANAGDLAALTLAILRELGNRIRNGNTDDYRQFWKGELTGRQLIKPKHEEDCRNALLSDLQQRLLPLGIDAQPEARYADEKRTDIRVSFGGTGGFEVPIEIKKNDSLDLWDAIRNQLIAKYTREPNCDGHGIFLVLWFGSGYTKSNPDMQRPQTAAELENCLQETLSVDESRKISICVIDVAKPK